MRIGHGYDVHRFITDKPLIIGGVEIPHEQGLEAHSDGDVLIHAICDALLGAAGLWDIGHHFPDDDAAYAGVDSRVLLRLTRQSLADAGFCPANIDATVIAQAPKLAGYIPLMREKLADDLQIQPQAINIKATTTEYLGFAGRKEGIAAHAVTLIESLNA